MHLGNINVLRFDPGQFVRALGSPSGSNRARRWGRCLPEERTLALTLDRSLLH